MVTETMESETVDRGLLYQEMIPIEKQNTKIAVEKWQAHSSERKSK